MIDAYASGKQVHSTTNTKISQTWLASHTGAIEWSMTSRGRSPRLVPPATRSQKPAPKSAPPKTAYMVIAANRMTAAVVLIGAAPSRSSVALDGSLGPYGTSASSKPLAVAGTGGSSRAAPGSW